METETMPSSDSISTISTTWLLIYTAVALFVVHQLYTYTYFWRKGIPGPIPVPLFGNFLGMMSGFLPVIVKWGKKYGTNFGMYMGKSASIITGDVDLARLILVKEFPSFLARDNGALKIRYMCDALTAQSGAPWKRSRSYMSPAFSGSKMKQMIPSLTSRCDIMMEILDKKHENGEGFETKPTFMPYVLDCIARCAFGIEADCQRDPDDPFVKNANIIFSDTFRRPAFVIAFIAPFLVPIMEFFGLELFPRKPMDFFANIVKRAVELRKEGGLNERKDFLQLMIDAAEIGEEDEKEIVKNGAKDDQVKNGTAKKIPLTIDELVGQSLIFFFAGFDTISTTSGFFLYALTTHPEIQTRLQEEIDEMIPEGEPIGYDAVFKMEYMDKVWSESMRLWPVGFLLTRYCNKDFSYKGLDISVGDNVLVNNWHIHHNPEHWPEPDKFDPERFSKEAKESRHPCAYMPFGFGPRNCVGMRFAILEAKMALIRILQKYRLELMPETPDLCDINTYGKTSLYPDKGIHIRHVPRN